MRRNPQSPVRRKTAGGVRLACLTAADNIRSLKMNRSRTRCLGYSVFDDEQVMRVPLVENRSSLVERLVFNQGRPVVTHTVTLVADRNMAQAWLEPDFAAEAQRSGIVVDLMLHDGRRIFAGCSAHFAVEQPMRIKSLTADSGAKPSDVPTLTLVLESVDTDFAQQPNN